MQAEGTAVRRVAAAGFVRPGRQGHHHWGYFRSGRGRSWLTNAAIEARHVETGTVYQAASTATGNYTISQLPAGTYNVSVAVPGLKGLCLAA